jgi:hypothetical protein
MKELGKTAKNTAEGFVYQYANGDIHKEKWKNNRILFSQKQENNQLTSKKKGVSPLIILQSQSTSYHAPKDYCNAPNQC